MFDDNNGADRPDEDQPTIYHIFQTKRRRAKRTIYWLRDGTEQMHTTASGMAQTLTTFLRNMNVTIEVNDVSVEILTEVVRCERHTLYDGMLESPFEPTEIYRAIQAGGRKKAPGNDGLCRQFYLHNWAIIKDDLCEVINQMFWAGNMSQQQTRGVAVCLPKAQGNQTAADCRHTHSATLTTRFSLVLSHNAFVQCRQIT
jgi:hypothetical protein